LELTATAGARSPPSPGANAGNGVTIASLLFADSALSRAQARRWFGRAGIRPHASLGDGMMELPKRQVKCRKVSLFDRSVIVGCERFAEHGIYLVLQGQ